MKDFIILVYNVNMVNSTEMGTLAKKIEEECECKVYQVGHIDMKCAPFYITWIGAVLKGPEVNR